MGCGASAASKYKSEARSEEVASLNRTVQQQSEQIGQLLDGQHRLVAQLSALSARLETSIERDGAVRSGSRGGYRLNDPIPAVPIRDAKAQGLVDWDQQSPIALRIEPFIQNYAWGKGWEQSLVAQLCETPERPLNRKLPYAEMWMGTHPNGPASVRFEAADSVGHTTKGMKETIASDPQSWLGQDAARGDLPYLLKVLSVSQALSIQAHPDKKLAEFLHAANPDAYKDANHKPEICLPLGEFEALVAFRPFDEIRKNVSEVRELQRLLGDKLQLNLKDMYSRLMRSDPALVAQQVGALVHRLSRREESCLSPEEKLVLRLAKDYPGDVGIFSVFFLNYVRIRADEHNRFIFCAPNEPHAYLYGDCVECMSLSDNVVRAGLTPKFKDVETLLNMMTYKDDRLANLVGVGKRVSSKVLKYDPPVDDFVVYEVEGGGVSEPLELPHASICLCTSGSYTLSFNKVFAQVEEVSRGQSFFARAGTSIHVIRSDWGSRLFIATY